MNREELERELRAMPGMVRWFSPLVLLQTARQAIDAALFGQYADRRLMQAALDPIASQVAARSDLSQTVKPDEEGAVWVDFVADLGDGFNPTYAIAYLLSRKSLDLGADRPLPRAGVLIMGGDQVYPAATRAHYDSRMKKPYEWAFPRPSDSNAERPKLFLIPGNHDWYDGLVLFLAKFCRGRPTAFGNWQATQHRSYFALRLPENWWIWGMDVQLSEDIDAPQADYFAAVAREMPAGAKIILCSAVPSWLMAKGTADDKIYRSLDYIACIARDECEGATICAVLSGDLHHYSRYSGSEAGTQFITAGGGGAFLHPTHNLRDRITAKWVRQPQTLSLKTSPDKEHAAVEKPACYPSREQSRRLLWGNLAFPLKNWEFSVALGLVYWVLHHLLVVWRPEVAETATRLDVGAVTIGDWLAESLMLLTDNPMFVVVLAALWAALFAYADGESVRARIKMGAAHAAAHGTVVMLLAFLIPLITAGALGLTPGGLSAWILGFVMCIAAGFAGGLIWGIYLLASCLKNRHCNDAFSALRIEGFKNFLRLRIKGEELTIYAIGLDAPPEGDEWILNPHAREGDPNEPVVLPRRAIKPRLIEPPIVIAAHRVTPVGSVGS